MRGFAVVSVMIGLVLVAVAVFVLSEQSSQISAESSALQDRASLDNLMETAEVHAKWELQQSGCADYSSVTYAGGGGSYGATFGAVGGSPIDISLSATLDNGMTRSQTLSQQVSYDSVTTDAIKLKHGTYVRKDDDEANYGSHHDIHIGKETSKARHGFLYFDLTAISPSAEIESATLRLHIDVVGESQDTFTVHRITQSWKENETTWAERWEDASWSTNGGSHTSSEEAQFVAPSVGWVEVDITALAQRWHKKEINNYGVLIKSPNPSGSKEMKIQSAVGDPNIAELLVEHKCECGGVCSVANYVTCDANVRPNSERSSFPPAATGNITGATAVPPNIALMGVTFPDTGGYVLSDNRGILEAFDTSGTSLGTCDASASGVTAGLTYAINGTHKEHIGLLINGAGGPEVHFVGETCAIGSTIEVQSSAIAAATGVAFIETGSVADYEDHFAVTNKNGFTEVANEAGVIVHTITPDVAAANVTGLAHVYNDTRLLILNQDTDEVYRVGFDGGVVDRYDYTRFSTGSPGALAVDMESCDHVIPSDADNKAAVVYQKRLSLDPVAHWRLDEALGPVAFDAMGEHHAAATPGVTFLPSSGAAQGAVEFNATGEFAAVADTTALDITGSITVAGWINTAGQISAFIKHNTIISKHTDGNEHHFWLGLTENKATFTLNNGTPVTVSDTQALNANEWYHLAVVWDEATTIARLYVNGIEVTSAVIEGPLNPVSGTTSLGAGSLGLTHANGLIDDVMVFSGALSQDDIAVLISESSEPLGSYTVSSGGSDSVSDGGSCDSPQSYGDDFESAWNWQGSTGSLTWSGSWSELNDSWGLIPAQSGDVRKTDYSGSRAGHLKDKANIGIERSVDLGGFATASISFNYGRVEMDDTDYVSVLLDTGDVTEVGRVEGSGAGVTDMTTQSFQADIPVASLADGAVLRLVTNSTFLSNEDFYIDNLVINGCPP